ncbi:hypothetical protein LIER_32211 [Lithospermum erythrorhizon]|uniref:Reverse transcriptase RNase H-like domain-containing protein n=1 Tax=Lithospermum erythrorhizon TaxID=34254 RepID=A0AAV3RT95_LITER
MEIYVDDMIIKSWEADDHEANLRESFDSLRRYKLWLNLDNRGTGHAESKDPEGSSTPYEEDGNPDPVHISGWGLESTLFKAIKKGELLARPVAGDVMQLYLAVSESALSSVLVRDEEKVQRPVYYVSQVMRGAETRYPLAEKLVYALIVAARKLKPYFEAHLVEVVTYQPLLQILENPNQSGQIVKWAIELSEVELWYNPRTSIKA